MENRKIKRADRIYFFMDSRFRGNDKKKRGIRDGE